MCKKKVTDFHGGRLGENWYITKEKNENFRNVRHFVQHVTLVTSNDFDVPKFVVDVIIKSLRH